MNELFAILWPGDPTTWLFAVLLGIFLLWLALTWFVLLWQHLALARLRKTWEREHKQRFASADDLRDIEERLKRPLKEVLAHCFAELREATFNKSGHEEPLQVYPAAHFITPERFRDGLLLRSPWLMSPGLLDALPGLFTAIGILGTFIGLVLGLSETGSDGMPDAQRLVGGLHVSFKSSIYGLSASLLSTIMIRWLDSKIAHNVEGLTDWLDTRMRRGTEHAVLTELLREQTEATSAIKKLKDDMREAFQKAINETLVPVIQDAMDGRSEAQLEGVGKIVDGVLASLGKQLERAATRFEEAADRTQAAGEWWERVSKQLSEVTAQQQRLAELINGSLQPLGVAAGHFSEAAAASKSASERLDGAAQTTSEGLQVLAGQLAQTLGAGQEALERMEAVREAWSESASVLQLASADLNEGLDAFVGKFPAAIEKTMTEFDRELAQVGQRLAGASENMRQVFEELDATLQRVLESAKGRR